MPELPEVELTRRRVEDHGLRRVVETVSVRPGATDMLVSESTLRGALRGHTLTAARRHGKHLFLRSGEDRGRWLRLHFGMTGSVEVVEEGGDEPEHTRLRLDLRGGRSLAFDCPRTFGEIDLVESPERFVEEAGLGPDPWTDELDAADFARLLEGRRGMVKSALMDQELLAGLGNLYSDEALFQVGLHPEARVPGLSDDRIAELWEAVTEVLETTVECEADPDRMPRSWLRPHRDDGVPCPRCDGTIRRAEVAGRGCYLCDTHQSRD